MHKQLGLVGRIVLTAILELVLDSNNAYYTRIWLAYWPSLCLQLCAKRVLCLRLNIVEWRRRKEMRAEKLLSAAVTTPHTDGMVSNSQQATTINTRYSMYSGCVPTNSSHTVLPTLAFMTSISIFTPPLSVNWIKTKHSMWWMPKIRREYARFLNEKRTRQLAQNIPKHRRTITRLVNLEVFVWSAVKWMRGSRWASFEKGVNALGQIRKTSRQRFSESTHTWTNRKCVK